MYIIFYHNHFIECILRNMYYGNIEIQKIRFTILLVHGNISFIQCSWRRSICLSRFQIIIELSCHLIFEELFAMISVLYRFIIHVFTILKTLLAASRNLLDLLFPVNHRTEQSYKSYSISETEKNLII